MSDASREILRAWLRRELALGSAYLDDQVAHLYSGALGRVVNPLVGIIYRFAQRERILRRARAQMGLLLDLAERWDGTNTRALVESRLEDLLKTEELYMRGKKDHPRFPEVADRLRQAFEGRLESLARIFRARGTTYDELAVSAYPTLEEAMVPIRRQFQIFEELLTLVETEENLLAIPRVIRREILHILRSVYEWYRAEVEMYLRRMYGAQAPATVPTPGSGLAGIQEPPDGGPRAAT